MIKSDTKYSILYFEMISVKWFHHLSNVCAISLNLLTCKNILPAIFNDLLLLLLIDFLFTFIDDTSIEEH